MKVKKIVLTAVLTALSIVLNELLVISIPPTSTPIIQFSLGIIPLLFIAYYCGIFYAASSAVIADILGFFLFSKYIFNPGFTLNALLAGLILGFLMFKRNSLNSKKGTIIVLVIAALLSLISVSIFLIYFIFGSSFLGDSFTVSGNTFTLSLGLIITVSALNILITVGLILYTVLSAKEKDSNAIVLSFVIYIYIVALVLTPLWVTSYSSIPYFVFWIIRLVIVPFEALVYSIITKLILYPLRKVYKPYN